MNKRCITCGERLSGRSDKKFCNQACRNDFHNEMKPRCGSLESRLLLSFRKNRSILTEFIQEGKQQAAMDELLQKGFDPLVPLFQLKDHYLQINFIEYPSVSRIFPSTTSAFTLFSPALSCILSNIK